MLILKPTRLLGAAMLLSASALAAAAQQAPTEPSPPAEKPPMAKPESTPQTAPTPQKPAIPARPEAKAKHPLMGLTVGAADGSKVGDVRAVNTAPDGKVTALHIKTGGFLGFGGKIVAIPEGKFTQRGDNIQLGMTADDVSKRPEVKDAT